MRGFGLDRLLRRLRRGDPSPAPGVDVLWARREKGGKRRIALIPVRVAGYTPAGAAVVTRERRDRIVRESVMPWNLYVPIDVEQAA